MGYGYNAARRRYEALLWIGPPRCPQDCDRDHALTPADFNCFHTKLALGEAYADCNSDGVRNLADFGCFQTKFALGCP